MNSPIFEFCHEDVLTQTKKIESESIDLIICDPPYFNYLKESWDRQWKSEKDYLLWIEYLFFQLSRVLKKTGSFYCFCSSKLEYKIIPVINRNFNVLNSIVWAKTNGSYNRARKDNLKKYYPQSERIVFSEHTASEKNLAHMRSECLKPLIQYFVSAFKNSSVSSRDLYSTFGTHMHKHWFSLSQWAIPNIKSYTQLQSMMPELNRTYVSVREEYAVLTQKVKKYAGRPFNVNAPARPFTDVWSYCPPYSNRTHPCQKPKKMIDDIISMSSNPHDIILDPFAGSFVVADCSRKLNRSYIGIENNYDYYKTAVEKFHLNTKKNSPKK